MFACLIPLVIFLAPSILNTIIIIALGCLIYGIIILLLKERMLFDTINNLKNKLKKENSHR